MTDDVVRAAERLVREAEELVLVARAAAEARALAATWPDAIAPSRTLVERVSATAIRVRWQGVLGEARGWSRRSGGPTMGEADRTSEARMRAAVVDVVAAFDRHGDRLNRDEAISVLGSIVGAYALAWGGEIEVVGKAVEVAKGFILKGWQLARTP